MMFFYKCISKIAIERILNPIVVFAANLNVLKNGSKWDRKITK